MYVNGVYLENNPTWDAEDAVWKVRWMHQLLQRHPIPFDKVVEAGCGSGEVLAELAELYPQVSSFAGYDISPQAMSLTSKFKDPRLSFHQGDYLEQAGNKADILLVIDVLEHVEDYYGFLSKLRQNGKYFIFHIPLDLSCRSVLKPHILLQQRNAVGYIHYFTREMVLWMLKDTGYELVDWIYTKPMLDNLPQASFKGKVKKILSNFFFALNCDWSSDLWGGYSMMIIAK